MKYDTQFKHTMNRMNGNEHLPLACVLNNVAHAALQSLRFAVRDAFAVATLTALLTRRPVHHRWGLGTFGLAARATCLLFARGILRFSAFHTSGHILAVLTARRVLIATNRALISSQFTVFVAARVVIFGAEQTSVALFVAFDTQIATE